MSAGPSLDELRREIDTIDNNIHDLIMRRTEVVEKVREAKRGQPVKIRPARECSILYRLNKRHKGPFPKRELARIWRELIVATLSFEGPFSIGVHTPEAGKPGEPRHDRHDDYWKLARDQYGSFTPMSGFSSARRLIDAVRSQKTTIGVLPMPERREDRPWWPVLASKTKNTPRIINRLPFIGGPTDTSTKEQALVVCTVASEPTGHDRTYLVVEAKDEIGLERLASALKEVRLEATFLSVWCDPETPSHYLHLAEVEGFVTDDDRKILHLSDVLHGAAQQIMTIGGYGLALTPEDLKTNK